MIQEYLLLKNDELKAIKECKPDGVKLRSFSANKGKCRYVHFSVDGDNEEAAKTLSKLDNVIRSKFNVTILESGCAAYFNKRLYPLINNFENKLRKLLYLTSAINENDTANNNIENLEAKNLGDIFLMLFIDKDFVKKVKEKVKEIKQECYTKDTVLSAIDDLEESALWDKLLGKNMVPTLRKRFNDIRAYRNIVMHSQPYMNWEQYKEIHELYSIVNSELEEALHDVEVVESKAPSRPNFNSALEQALKEQEEREKSFTALLQSGFEEMQRLQNLYATNPALAEFQQQAARISKAFTTDTKITEYQQQAAEICQSFATNPELLKLQKQIDKINKQFQNSPVVKAMQEQYKMLSGIKIAISPELQELASFAQIPRSSISYEALKLQKTLAALDRLNENTALHKTNIINNTDTKKTDGGNE